MSEPPVDTSSAYGRQVVTDEKPRCWRCNRVLAWMVTRPWAIKCGRCRAENRQG